MNDSLDIAEVARLTGLTSRALRFYEARGLVTPLRTASGRRHYGPAELERLHHIIAMKRAGLTLAQIQKLTTGKRLNLRMLVEARSIPLRSVNAKSRVRVRCSSPSCPASIAASPSMSRPSAR